MTVRRILFREEAERSVETRNVSNSQPTIAIIVPVHEKFHELRPCLTSLARNSARRHEVILAGDRTNWPSRGGPFKTLREWLQRKKDMGWLDRWGFKWLECPDCEELNTPRKEWGGQCGIGEYRAVNYAVRHMESEYYMVFDDDMWACPSWDINLWKHMRPEDRLRYVYMPVHCHVSHLAPWPYSRENVWFHDTVLPIHADMGVKDKATGQIAHFKESSLYEYYERTKQDGETLAEPCGLRRYVHWWPHVVHRELFERAEGFSPNANPWAAADCDYDRRLGRAGATKLLVMDSYIFHIKNNILLDVSQDIGFDEI